MIRLAVIVIALIVSISAGYADDSCAVGLDGARRFRYHVRFDLDGNSPHVLSLCWPDSAGTCCTEVVVTTGRFDDSIYPSTVDYTVKRQLADSIYIVAKGQFESRLPSTNPAFSLSLQSAAYGAALSLGATHAEASVPVTFNADSIYVKARGARVLRHTLLRHRAPESQTPIFASYSALRTYLSASVDPMECIWMYLDRDLNPDKARLADRYTLATVRDVDGYQLLLIDNKSDALTVKGFLADTRFEGHYNLLWRDAEGFEADAEANAALSVGGEVLELTFPSLGARVRFSRWVPSH